MKLTDSGRTVYGGGGITPDVKVDAPKSTPFEDVLLEHDAFQGFTEQYLSHKTVTKDFQVDDAVVSDFKQYLTGLNVEFTPQEITDNLGVDQDKHQVEAVRDTVRIHLRIAGGSGLGSDGPAGAE